MSEMISRVSANGRYEESRNISLMARDQYLREVAWVSAIEPLEAEEEGRLLRRLLRARCEPGNAHLQMVAKHARDRLVEGYQHVVVALARRACCVFRGVELLDLVGEGNIGLLNAVDQYSEAFHSPFAVLVWVCIRQALWQARYGSEQWSHVPEQIRRAISKVRGARAEWRQVHNEDLSSADLASRLGVSEALVEEALCVETFQRMESLQKLVREGDEDSSELGDFLCMPDCPVSGEDERHAQLRAVFDQALEQELTVCQGEVIRLLYGFDEGEGLCRSRGVVADLLGVTPQYVGMVERDALRRLHEGLEPIGDGYEMVCKPRFCREEYYDVQEAARVIGMSPATVRRYAYQGVLPAVSRGNGGQRGKWGYFFPKQALHEFTGDVDQELAS